MEEMLVKFDYFYGGHIGFPDIGFDATPVDGRVVHNQKLASVFEETKSMALIMDRFGFDTLWLSEHHFQAEGYGGIPNIPMTSVYLANFTEQLSYGGFFNTVPAWHPLRLAEDFAVADVMTNGRVRFGIGRGYIPREVETLGSPLKDDQLNREIFEEQVQIIIKAWSEDSFSHHGKHYDIPRGGSHRGKELTDITLVPRPINLPVEIWQPIASGSQRGMDFMVKHGIKGVVAGGTARGGHAERIFQRWTETMSKYGRETELGEDLALGLQIHMADTEEKAISEAMPVYEEQLKVLAPLGRFPKLTEDQVAATFDPVNSRLVGLPTVKDAVKDGTWICGPPSQIHEKISDIIQRFPALDRISVGLGGLAMPPSMIREDLEWFGKEVIPNL